MTSFIIGILIGFLLGWSVALKVAIRMMDKKTHILTRLGSNS